MIFSLRVSIVCGGDFAGHTKGVTGRGQTLAAALIWPPRFSVVCGGDCAGTVLGHATGATGRSQTLAAVGRGQEQEAQWQPHSCWPGARQGGGGLLMVLCPGERENRQREREFLHDKGICSLTFLCQLNFFKYAKAVRLHIPLYMRVLCRQGRVGHVREVWCSKVQKCLNFPRTEAWFSGCVKGREPSLTAVAVPGLQVVWRGGNCGRTWFAGCVVVWREVIVTNNSGGTWFAGCVVVWRGGNCHWQQWQCLVCRLCGCVKGR